jgi:tRNA (mo5U34)-methyltransferase
MKVPDRRTSGPGEQDGLVQQDSHTLKAQSVAAVPKWWHSIDLGDGVVTPGHKSPELLQEELASLRFPPLAGRTVLDIGTWDGFYAFEAERRGAARVVAIDHYVWACNWDKATEYVEQCRAAGRTPEPFERVPELWAFDTLPGKRGFDLAHELRASSVEAVVDNFMTSDLEELGTFDVALYLGVLYHQRYPLSALERVRQVTKGVAIIETHATVFAGFEQVPLWRFVEGDELNDDHTNWWVPNIEGLCALTRSAGFRDVEVVQGPPSALDDLPPGAPPPDFRAIVHAFA